MAVKINTTHETFSVISRKDSALPEDLTDAEFADYQKTLDEKILRLVGEPTRFVLRRNLPFAAQQAIDNQKLGINAAGKPEIKLGYILEEVRHALVDIRNPADETDPVPFKKAEDGSASYELVAALNDHGIAMELFTARQNRIGAAVPKK